MDIIQGIQSSLVIGKGKTARLNNKLVCGLKWGKKWDGLVNFPLFSAQRILYQIGIPSYFGVNILLLFLAFKIHKFDIFCKNTEFKEMQFIYWSVERIIMVGKTGTYCYFEGSLFPRFVISKCDTIKGNESHVKDYQF